MITHSRKKFGRLELGRGDVIENQHFEKCVFEDCVVVEGRGPRGVVRNVVASGCRIKGAPIYSVSFDNVEVENLSTTGTLDVVDCVFRRVTLRGEFGDLFIRPYPGSNSSKSSAYVSIDWAIDITEARFKSITMRGVPGEKLRRDPQTQIFVRGDEASSVDGWRDIPCQPWMLSIQATVGPEAVRPEAILIAASRDQKNYRGQVESIRILRGLGLAR